jgi:hypothetical protein
MPDVVSGGIIRDPSSPTPAPTAVASDALATSILVSPFRSQVKVTRRKTNTSDTILITVNKDARVIVNGTEVQ